MNKIAATVVAFVMLYLAAPLSAGHPDVPPAQREEAIIGAPAGPIPRFGSGDSPRPPMPPSGWHAPHRQITPDERPPREEHDTPERPDTSARVARIEQRDVTTAAVACDTNQYASLSGSALFQYIQDAGPACANQMFVGNSTTFAAFTKTKMISVANSTASKALSYNGTDPNNGLEALYLWLRAGFFVAYYNSSNLTWYNSSTSTFDSQVVSAARGAIDSLVSSGRFYDNSDANGRVIGEAIILMDSSESQAYFLPIVKEWLSRWSQTYAGSWYMRSAVNGVFNVLFRGHQRADFRAAVANDSVLISRLSAFVDKTWMLGTDAEFMIENGARELTRFLQYKSASIYPAVQTKTKAILAQYPLLHPLHLVAATNAEYYDDCTIYNVCNFVQQVEAQVLTGNYTCNATYQVRAQSMTTTQFQETCPKLTTQETYFHSKLATNNQPVASDFNTDLQVVVFNSSTDYQRYAGIIFGIDTNNGGMYLEGDPSSTATQARFICYRAEWLPAFEIWNLTHETVHYLDGRYDMRGGFGDYNTDSGKTVWWIEGLAEYVSKKDVNSAAITAARTRAYSLSTIFSNNYYSGTERVYTWGYLATRFMFERHPSDVTTILGYFRSGNYSGYLSWINARLTTYNTEFSTWCGTVQSGGGDATAPTVSLTAPASGATVSGTVTISASASDNVGVARVEFLVDGAVVGSDTTSPYSIGWSSTSVVNGSHSIQARAFDAAGNSGTSAARSVTVSNSSCSYTISPTSASYGATASSGSVSVTAGSGCAWTGASGVSWISVTSGSSGSGNGTVSYSVAANTTTTSRTGTMTIATRTFTVTQAGSGGTSATALSNGVGVGASGATGSQTLYYIDVPSGASNLVMALSGGTGDADMYTRFGSAPTLTTYDCRPYASGNNETCSVAAPSAGRYYVMLHGYSAYSGATLRASYTVSSTLRVISPNGGEVWSRGSVRTISWNKGSAARVDVALYRGTTFIQWITWNNSNTSYSWTIPTSLTASSTYTIRLIDYDNRSVTDSSDSSFTIN